MIGQRGARACAIGILLALAMATSPSAQTPDPSLYLPPAEGGVRRWQGLPGTTLTLRSAPDPEAPAVTELPAGAIVDNLGCMPAAGETWCVVRPFRGGPRGHVAAGLLRPAEGPDGIVARGRDDSPRRARRGDFDATGTIRCAQERGQPLADCPAGIARGIGGDATARVTFPAGFARLLFFVHGEFIAANPTMSGVGTDTDWSAEDGLLRIRVEDQRFEIPAALIFGG